MYCLTIFRSIDRKFRHIGIKGSVVLLDYFEGSKELNRKSRIYSHQCTNLLCGFQCIIPFPFVGGSLLRLSKDLIVKRTFEKYSAPELFAVNTEALAPLSYVADITSCTANNVVQWTVRLSLHNDKVL